MLKGQKGLSAVAIIIIILVIAILLLVVFTSTPDQSNDEPGVIDNDHQQEEEEAPQPEGGLIPLGDIPLEWLEQNPEIIEQYPDGLPENVFQELNEKMSL